MYDDSNVEYVNMRLTGTIIRHNDRAVMVHDVKNSDAGILVASKVISTGEYITDTLKKYNLVPVSLGFVNGRGWTNYFTRVPMRRDWRQGLRAQNVRRDGEVTDLSNATLVALSKTIEGIFPSYEEAAMIAARTKVQTAWTRDFCVCPNHSIKFKTYGVVGEIKRGDVLLDGKFTWVEESLKEVL
jgi:hypothetical protein